VPAYSEQEQRNIDQVNKMFGSPRDFDRSTLFADDAVWWNGLPLLPGMRGETEHKGVEEIRKILHASGTKGKPGAGTDSYDKATNAYSDVVVLADGDFVVRQHTMTSTTLGGQSYQNVYCFVYRFNDEGKIQYLTEHWNTWHAHNVLFNNFAVEPAHPLG
jgi:ketosteroid isomerase-like protein